MAAKPTYDELLRQIENLKKNIESYRTIIDNTQYLFYRTDLQGRIKYDHLLS